VDLFFALSAYLITSLLLKERETTGTLDSRVFTFAGSFASGRSTSRSSFLRTRRRSCFTPNIRWACAM